MKKYRIKKVTDFSSQYQTIKSIYYPQERRFGVWCYFDDPKNPRENMCFISEKDAWFWIDREEGIRKECKTEYIYERKKTTV